MDICEDLELELHYRMDDNGAFGPDRVSLCWVPGHSVTAGNHRSDALGFSFD